MHAIEYFTTDKKKEITKIAEEWAYYNVDPYENESRSYHGNMKIHDDIICDSYEDAIEKIQQLDNGWYDDHAVRYRDTDSLKPTKAMNQIEERKAKITIDKNEYMYNHSVQSRKSEFIGCPKCKSKLAREHLKSERCPVCGAELRPEYVIERLKKYDSDYETLSKKYKELAKKRKESCPIRWCFKAEVHC